MALPSKSDVHNTSSPIVPNPDGSTAPYSDDMDDSTDLAHLDKEILDGNVDCKPFRDAVRIVQDEIFDTYLKLDGKAVWNQKWYNRVSILAVVSGTTSVFFAVMEMIKISGPGEIPVWWGEFLTASLTLLFIAIGTARNFKNNWILSRYKAERLRLLKFERLTDPSLWCDPKDLPISIGEIKDKVRQIRDEDHVGAESWAQHGVHPRVTGPPCDDRCPVALKRLVQYYIPKRLDVQTDYLERKSETVEERGTSTATWVRWVFFGSFAFVLVHLVLGYPNRGKAEDASHADLQTQTILPRSSPQSHPDSSSNPSPAQAAAQSPVAKLSDRLRLQRLLDTVAIKSEVIKELTWGDLFAILAIFLPIIATAIRTHRAAHEFERTAARHKSTLDSLEWLRSELRKTTDTTKQFEIIGFCELVLEADCREFLRLVSETEWYG